MPSPSLPLTPRRRTAMLAALLASTMHVMMTASCPMIALPFMAAYFGVPISAIAQTIGIAVLAIGLMTPTWAYACRIDVLGRRHAGLLGFALYVGCIVWLCLATTYASYAAGVFFTFAFGAVTQVVAVQQIAEVFDDNDGQRTRALASWYTALVVGPTLGPILGAAMLTVPHGIARATSFRNVYYLLLASGALMLAVMAACVPETAKAATQHPRDESNATLHDDEAAAKAASPPQERTSLLHKAWRWTRLYAPLVLPCAVLNGCLFGWSVALHIIMAQRLYLPPYRFTPMQLGLSYLPTIGGALLGELLGGYAITRALAAVRRRYTGHAAEQRLWALIVYLPLGAAGLLLFGFGFGRALAWPIAVVAGQGLFTCFYCAAATIMLNYLVEAHGGAQHASSIMCILKVVRAFFIFATLYFEPGWAGLHGGSLVKTAIVSAFVYKMVITAVLVICITVSFAWLKSGETTSAERGDVMTDVV